MRKPNKVRKKYKLDVRRGKIIYAYLYVSKDGGKTFTRIEALSEVGSSVLDKMFREREL